MIIVDTNVVSELLRPIPEPRVEQWLARQDGYHIYLTAISEAELRYGIAIMEHGRRRNALAEAIDRILGEDMAGRILPFDSAAAGEYATIAATRRAAGRPIAIMSRGVVYERRPSERSGSGQVATAGSLTVGLSVTRAMVSSDM